MARVMQLLAGAMLVALSVASAPAQPQSFPARPITLFVPWPVGAAGDAAARLMALRLGETLMQPVNVVNRARGAGLSGYHAIAAAVPDGHTIGYLTADLPVLHWTGVTGLRHTDFTPIALVGSSAPSFVVRPDFPYASVTDALAAIRAHPGRFRASLLAAEAEQGLEQLLAGTVDLVVCLPAQARKPIESGRARALAGTWAAAGWSVVAGPKGMPAHAQARLMEAIRTVHDSREFRDFMSQRGLAVVWAGADEARRFLAEAEAEHGTIVKAVTPAK